MKRAHASADLPSANDVSPDPRRALVQRITTSPHFRASSRLCDFLIYICECAIRGDTDDLTEQLIGVNVFSRVPGYSSSDDSIVRSQARLLRLKLEGYFASEGASEDYFIEIPRGHYLPVFRKRVVAPVLPEADLQRPKRERPLLTPKETPETEAETAVSAATRSWVKAVVVAVCLMVFSVGAIRLFRARPTPTDDPIETFWSPFFTRNEALLIYSNATFVGDSTKGLRYRSSGMSNDQQVIDDYTGIGEVAAVHQLTRIFDAHRATFLLKRSGLVTWDEARVRNLVFVGSRGENLALRDLPVPTDFTIAIGAERPPGFGAISNLHPKPGEQSLYLGDDHRPLHNDYAIIALLPGVQPGNKIILLGGLTTLGTQAAVEYVCRPETVAELVRSVGRSGGQLRSFEAVLETTIRGGVPLQTKIVAIHVH